MGSPRTIKITKEKVLELKQILEEEQGKTYSFEETQEIAFELVNFYTYLKDVAGGKIKYNN